jgi:hypothetical protein
MPKFKLENLKFEELMKDYAEIRKVTIPDAVNLNARLLCIELARRTQPFGNSDESGKSRVEKDIGKVIKSKDKLNEMASYINGPHLKTYVKGLILSGQNGKLIEIFDKIGFLKKWKDMEFISSYANIHKSNRNKNTGRTYGKADKLYIADESSLSKYTQEIQKRVGLSKAGWAQCASLLKKVNKGSNLTGFPSFVKSAMVLAKGDIVDNTANESSPSVRLTNLVPWIDRILPLSEQTAALSVVGAKMKKQMAKILKKKDKTLTEE